MDTSQLDPLKKRYDRQTVQSLPAGTIVTRVAPGDSSATTGDQYMIQVKLVADVSHTVLLPVLAVPSSSVIPASAEEMSDHESLSIRSLEIEVPTESVKQKQRRLLEIRQAWWV